MSEWERELTDLEIRALLEYFSNPDNECEKIDEKEYPDFMDEGLTQTLLKDPRTKECVLFIRQKGYTTGAFLITPENMKDFLDKWKKGELSPYSKEEMEDGEEVTDDEER